MELRKWMRNRKLFLNINLITLGSVIVLILVGSIVRSLGAGMGCPDWPKCFGSYVPPTSAEALPDNYLEIFRDQRLKKNERLARTFITFGFDDVAEKITNDPFVLEEQEFDVAKAWIEYINRLVGVLIGFLVFLNMIFSFSFWSTKRAITIGGVLVFVLTGFQGWVGSLVVSTNLLHGFITFHMVLALVIVALLIWMQVVGRGMSKAKDRALYWLSFVMVLLFIPQLLFGTEVRAVVDDLIVGGLSRSVWANSLEDFSFYIHRSYSWVLLAGAFGIYYLVRRGKHTELMVVSKGLITLVLVAMVAGIGMAWFDFPAWLQPLHLIVATGIFSLLFYLNLRIKIQ